VSHYIWLVQPPSHRLHWHTHTPSIFCCHDNSVSWETREANNGLTYSMLPSLSSLSLSLTPSISLWMNTHTHPSWSSYVYSLFIKMSPYWAPRQIKNMSVDRYRAVMFAWTVEWVSWQLKGQQCVSKHWSRKMRLYNVTLRTDLKSVGPVLWIYLTIKNYNNYVNSVTINSFFDKNGIKYSVNSAY